MLRYNRVIPKLLSEKNSAYINNKKTLSLKEE